MNPTTVVNNQRLLPPDMPRIVCLCGSTRFWKTFQEQSLRLTKLGIIVLSIGGATASDDEHGITPEEKVVFEALHKRKIELADEVFVLNVGGYIGESTRAEIDHAIAHGKRVVYLEDAGAKQEILNPDASTAKSDPLPSKVKTIIPMLVCRDAAAEIDFCKTAFEAVELSRRANADGMVVHATLKIAGALLMVHGEVPNLASRAPQMDGSSPVVTYLYVESVDAVIARAMAAGAKVLIPAANQFWGDRVGRIMDSAGHVWNIAARL